MIFVYFFYIETRGPTLEEVAKLFDGSQEELPHDEVVPLDRFHVRASGFEKSPAPPRPLRPDHFYNT